MENSNKSSNLKYNNSFNNNIPDNNNINNISVSNNNKNKIKVINKKNSIIKKNKNKKVVIKKDKDLGITLFGKIKKKEGRPTKLYDFFEAAEKILFEDNNALIFLDLKLCKNRKIRRLYAADILNILLSKY